MSSGRILQSTYVPNNSKIATTWGLGNPSVVICQLTTIVNSVTVERLKSQFDSFSAPPTLCAPLLKSTKSDTIFPFFRKSIFTFIYIYLHGKLSNIVLYDIEKYRYILISKYLKYLRINYTDQFKDLLREQSIQSRFIGYIVHQFIDYLKTNSKAI